ncbi:MAG: carboxypeptidase-like regulatory domain-containing protein [Aureliella sp.]
MMQLDRLFVGCAGAAASSRFFRSAGFVRSVCVVLCAMAAGCGSSGPQLADVTGTVTLDGKPVPNAIVTFNPVEPGGSNSLGKTDAQGNYRLEFSQDRKGAMIGKHEVEITTKKISPDEMPDSGEAVESVYVPIPAKYRKRGELTAEVKNQRNEINFDLTSK